MSVIALLTDFGLKDHYVAAMKGMILQIDPKASIVDITHEIDPQDLYQAAFSLRQAYPYFPEKTIFVAVVDPTVGTHRRILAARYNNRTVLAPDNGLITMLHRDANLQEIRVVENHNLFARLPSITFHGRDIFAPVAAHLSKGMSLDRLGPVTDHIETLELPRPSINQDYTIDGQVALADGFGNLITNISTVDLSACAHSRKHYTVSVGPHNVGPIHGTYADVPPGQPLALIGSSQMLEIAVNQGNAAHLLNVNRGCPVRLA